MKRSKIDFNRFNIPFPFSDDREFQRFCKELFNEWKEVDDFIERGDLGQKQNGFDVFSSTLNIAIECKVKNINKGTKARIRSKLVEELKEGLEMIQEVQGIFNFTKYYLISTFTDDTEIQNKAKELELAYKGKIQIEYWGWGTVADKLNDCPITADKYFNAFRESTANVHGRNNSRKIPPENDPRPIEEQLYESVRQFFPLAVFKKFTLEHLYPFSNSSQPGHSYQFTLSIPNQKAFNYLAEVSKDDGASLRQEIHGKEATSLNEKSKYILEILRANLFENINHGHGNNVSIPSFGQPDCQCRRCQYSRLEFSRLIKSFSLPTEALYTLDGKVNHLKKAHMLYLTGNFIESYKALTEIIEACERGKDTMLEFVCNYNLKSLYNHIDYNYNDSKKKNILLKIDQIDLNNIIHQHAVTQDLREQMQWIKENGFTLKIGSFVDEEIHNIQLAHKKENNVQSALPGLLNHFYYVYQFTRLNFVFYETFAAYQSVMLKCFDSLLAAYKVQDNNFKDPRLSGSPLYTFKFGEDMLLSAIFHIPHHTLTELFSKYEICSIKIDANGLVKKTENFLSSIDDLTSQIQAHKRQGNSHLLYKYNQIFANILYLISKVELTNSQFQKLPGLLIEFIKNDKNLFSYSISSLHHLIYQKGSLFSPDELISLLKILEGNKNHRGKLVYAVSETLAKYFKDYRIKDKKLIQKIVVGQKHFHKTNLIDYWKVASGENKIILSEKIVGLLNEQFDTDFYMSAVIAGAIDHQPFFDYCLKGIANEAKGWGYETTGKKTVAFSYGICRFIQLLYRLQIDLRKDKIQSLGSYHPYIDWLLNIDSFDYTNFKREWLRIYPVNDFYKAFKCSAVLVEYVESSLKLDYDPWVAKALYKHLK
jgi:hypothetical protein